MSRETCVISVFTDGRNLAEALRRLKEAGLQELSVYSPVGLLPLEETLPRRGSPIRFIALLAGLAGLIGGFWLCVGSAKIYDLIVGGKAPASLLPYWIVGFEGTILLAGLVTVAAVIAFARLRPGRPAPGYRPAFAEDKFGLCVHCAEDQLPSVAELLRQLGAEEVHEQRAPVGD